MKKLLYVILCVMMLCVCLSIVGCESVTPQLRINSETLYWEVSYDNGATWESLDVKAVGENGTNGENGTDGVDGTDGTDISIGENGNWFIDGVDTGKPATSRIDAPKFRINDDTFYWEVSYDDGETWESLDVVAIGEDGTKVTIGPNDNWFIDGVDTGRLAFDFEAKFRFLVASDVHMQANGAAQSLVRFETLIDSAYAYSASSKNYKNLDGMFFCGDLTEDGRDTENQLFWDTLNAKTKEGTTSRAILGNHDFRINGYNEVYSNPGAWSDYVADSITAKRFKEEWAGYDADSRIEIGGYQFIFLSMDQYDKDNGIYYREGRRAWLKAELDNAVAADPTGQKPIFVFNHMGPRGTAAGTEGTGADLNLHNILKDYPNVVDFSGHVHMNQINPNSVWQGEYTAVAVGSLTGTKIPLNGDPTRTGVSQALTGDMAWICELDDTNTMRLVCFDYLRGEVYRTYYLDSFGNPAGFDYTSDREIIPDTPKFDKKADVTVVSNNYKKVDIKFPQAKSDNLVTTYVVDVLNSSDEIIKTEYVLSGAHLTSDQPKELKLSLGGLEQNTTYTINVCAYTFYDEKSLPLSVTFTTTAKPTGVNVTPDVLSVQFNVDGTAKDTVSNTLLEVIGDTPATIAYNETIGRNAATFTRISGGKTGKSGFRFDAYGEWEPILANEFTMELYLAPGYVPLDLVHIKPM
ncbi:MAG: metallophosphoesterase, partial [Clostridia bacterium]|nr:metallophosphoesterase [Clostridia bacterium]